jgi:hypothetical protein
MGPVFPRQKVLPLTAAAVATSIVLAGCMVLTADGEVDIFIAAIGAAPDAEVEQILVTFSRVEILRVQEGASVITCPTTATTTVTTTATGTTRTTTGTATNNTTTTTSPSPTVTTTTNTTAPNTTTTSPATTTSPSPTPTENTTQATGSYAGGFEHECPGVVIGQVEEGKVGVCHRTGSDSNPYEFIVVDESAWESAHRHHHGDFRANSEQDCQEKASRIDCTTLTPGQATTTRTTATTTPNNTTSPSPTNQTSPSPTNTTTPAPNTTMPTPSPSPTPTTAETEHEEDRVVCVTRAPADMEDADWVILVQERRTVDLLQVTDDQRAFLATREVETGRFSFVRVEIEAVTLVLRDGTQREVVVQQGQVDQLRSFNVESDRTSAIVVFLDLERSLQVVDEDYVFTPVVTRVDVEVGAETQTWRIVGTVEVRQVGRDDAA